MQSGRQVLKEIRVILARLENRAIRVAQVFWGKLECRALRAVLVLVVIRVTLVERVQ